MSWNQLNTKGLDIARSILTKITGRQPDESEQCNIIASLLGLIANSDNDISDDESEQAWQFIMNLCFDDSKHDKTIVRKVKEVMSCFEHPLDMAEIILFADKYDIREDFYKLACIMVASDNEIDDSEKLFLERLAENFNISDYDKKNIEDEFLV